MQDRPTSPHDAGHGSMLSYSIGFVLSVVLTLGAYLLVVRQMLHGRVLLAAILVLAVVQLMVQLVFFLHLGRESKPRWNLIVFLFMLIVLVILVFGSLWIMNNLNYHMMPSADPSQTDMDIFKDEGISP